MDSAEARRRFAEVRVARLASVDGRGQPHLVPIVFALEGERIYHAVDAKRKRTTALRRLANIRVNPRVALLADHYEDADWQALWWVRADGRARVLEDPADEMQIRRALELLAARYPQQHAVGPVIAVEVERWVGWCA